MMRRKNKGELNIMNMEDGSEDVVRRMWFNSHLFVVDNQPLKFYLLGYDQMECRDIVRIIEAYGGKLSAPDVGTTVFSEPHRFTAYDGDLYHIKCLYDSIVTNQFQDIRRYRLLSASQTVTPVTTDTLSSSQIQDNQTLNPSGSVLLKCTEKTRSDPEIVPENGETDAKGQEFLDQTEGIKFVESTLGNSTCDIDESFSTTSYYSSRPCKNNKERLQSMKASANQLNSPEIDDSCTAARTKPYIAANKLLKCSGNIPIGEHSKENLITSPQNSSKMEHDQELEEVSSRGRNRKRHSYEEIPSDISSSEEMTVSKRHNRRRRKNLPSIKHFKLINSEREIPSSVSRERFTDEEDRQLIKCLIDNDVISRATGHTVWKQVKAAMPNSSRSERTLRRRYISYLRYDYAKYTDDPKALAEFAANVAKKQNRKLKNNRPPSTFSDQDIKKMVDYLVSSDIFSRPSSTMIWKEIIRKQILKSPVTSWWRVYSIFRRNVLPVIDKYVSDPGIIEKFRVLLLKMTTKREHHHDSHAAPGVS